MFMGLLFAVLSTIAHATDWEVLGVTDGVKVSRKTTPGSDLFAFRGEKITDVPASKLSSVILNDPIGPEWVDLMYLSTNLNRYDEYTKLVHQGYDLPWPIQDRDYVMKQTATYDGRGLHETWCCKSGFPCPVYRLVNEPRRIEIRISLKFNILLHKWTP